jgi:hypothetical protein
MKQFLKVVGLVLGMPLFAQNDQAEIPYSGVNNVFNIHQTHIFEGNPLDVDALLNEDANSTSGFPRAGVVQSVQLNLTNSGTWFDLDNGDKLWRLILKVPNALAVNAYFDQFLIPQGGKLFVYSPNYREILEPMTSNNNPESGYYATDYIHGETVVLEYLEPRNMIGVGNISIHGLNGFYNMIEPLVDDKTANYADRSGSCQVDVNCSEGDNWRPQINGVVRLTLLNDGDTGFCSGSLVNNTAEDCTPYILSAHHCAVNDNNINSTPADMDQWIFRFNFQNNTCGSPVAIGSYSMIGCSKVARSTNNDGIKASDYILLELNDPIDETRAPYFNGWDATGAGSSSGVAVHHPAGDKKKISTYNTNLVTSNWTGSPSGSHWRVNWIGTPNGHGVNEGGSSGSPLFNSEGLIVGQLSGGQSECNDVLPGGQNLPDLYGKMSYNWSGGGVVESLKAFLDPIGNGTTKTMQGNYYLCSQGNGVVNGIEDVSQLSDMRLFPNPAADQFIINLDDVPFLDLTIYNQIGEQVVRFPSYEVGTPVNISYLPAGLYYVKAGENGIFKTKKLMVQ